MQAQSCHITSPDNLLLGFCKGDEKQRFIIMPNSSSKALSVMGGTGKKA